MSSIIALKTSVPGRFIARRVFAANRLPMGGEGGTLMYFCRRLWRGYPASR